MSDMSAKERFEIEVTCLNDISMDKRVYAAAEAAYRRGYHQGFFAAMFTPLNEQSSIFKKITDWRFLKNNNQAYFPPEYKKEKTNAKCK